MRIGMTQRLYNAEIRNRRLQMGLTARQLGEKIGISAVSIYAAEALKSSTKSPTISKLAEFFGTSPEVIYPPWIEAFKLVSKIRDVQQEFSEKELRSIAENNSRLTWQRDIEKLEAKAIAKEAIQKLTPRQQQILALKFGLLGEAQHTLEEVSKKLSISRSRVGQIVKKCLRRLRYLHEKRAIDLGELRFTELGGEKNPIENITRAGSLSIARDACVTD